MFYLKRNTIVLITIISVLFSCKNYESDITIINPYETVNWNTWWQYKANLHMHTTISDGYFSPNNVIDYYSDMNYKILAITDHNHVTYPWSSFSIMESSAFAIQFFNEGLINEEELVYSNRYSEKLGLLSVQANELSNHHHLGSYFNNHNGTNIIETSLDSIRSKNGLAVLFHPIKYSYTMGWYLNLFTNYDCLLGVEVFNQKYKTGQEIYLEDFILWDSLLYHTMPNRQIFAFTNDDFHTTEKGYAYTVYLMPEFSENWFRKAMTRGMFYYVIAENSYYESVPPTINNIRVNHKKSEIFIHASNYSHIEWISEGKTIHTGNRISLSRFPEVNKYIRAVIFQETSTSIAGTQAFGIIR